MAGTSSLPTATVHAPAAVDPAEAPREARLLIVDYNCFGDHDVRTATLLIRGDASGGSPATAGVLRSDRHAESGSLVSGIAAHVGHERDAPVEAWEGIVRWRTLLSAGRTPSAGMTIGSAEVEPGSSIEGASHHHADHEAYYVVVGTGRVHLDGVEHDVEAGSIVFIPGDTSHVVHNTGTSTLKLLYVFPVDRFEDVDYVFDD